MKSCEMLKCNHWNGKFCTDKEEFINEETKERVCRYHEDAILINKEEKKSIVMDAKDQLEKLKLGSTCQGTNCGDCINNNECHVMFCKGYHLRDEEVKELQKQTGEYEKDIINIQKESFDKDREIDELKELKKIIKQYIKISCELNCENEECDEDCFIYVLKNKINEVLK